VEQVGVRADRVIARAVNLAAAAVEKTTSQKRDVGRPEAMEPMSQERDMGHPDSKDGAERVALFAHAHILRILAVRWVGLPAVDGAKLALGTGSVSVLGFERETRVVQRWNRSFEED
jgi:hypothetical protein